MTTDNKRTIDEIRYGRRTLMFLPACVAAALTVGLGWTFLEWLAHFDPGWWRAFEVAGFLLGTAFGCSLMSLGAGLVFYLVLIAADPRQRNKEAQ